MVKQSLNRGLSPRKKKKMNDITLDGIIWGIKDSHKINDVQYQTANITVKNSNGKDSVITLQFKKFQCNYTD